MDHRHKQIAVLVAVLFVIGTGTLIYLFLNSYLEYSAPDGDPQSLPSETLGTPSPEYAEAVEQARLFARGLIVDENLPGLSVAIAVDNELVWAEGFGWSDLKGRIPVTPYTQFRIGGTTKTLTAAAAGLLFERGLLDLDVPVQKYVTNFPKKQWEINTRQLMGHVAGIRHYKSEDELFTKKHYNNVLESLETFASDPLLFEPSTAYKYSSHGWVVVGAVIQSAADEPYLNFMEREIFKPLDMKSTVPDYVDNPTPNQASLYRPFMARNTRFGLESEGVADLSGKLPAEGFLSTPQDLVQFGMAFLDGKLLKPRTVEMLHTVQKLSSGEYTKAGLGWHVSSSPFDGDSTTGTAFSAPGYTAGGTSSFMIFPEHRMVIAIVSNVSFAEGLEDLTFRLASVISQK